jgi:hypothetical protein
VTDKDRISSTSNVIRSNGQYGIQVGLAVSEQDVVIRGNYLGVTASNVPQANKAGNIVFAALAAGQPEVAPTFVRSGSEYMYTATKSSAHGLRVGDKIIITNSGVAAGLTGPSSGEAIVSSVVSPNSFTFKLIAASAGSAEGGSLWFAKSGSSDTPEEATFLRSVSEYRFDVTSVAHGLMVGHKVYVTSSIVGAGLTGLWFVLSWD